LLLLLAVLACVGVAVSVAAAAAAADVTTVLLPPLLLFLPPLTFPELASPFEVFLEGESVGARVFVLEDLHFLFRLASRDRCHVSFDRQIERYLFQAWDCRSLYEGNDANEDS
jgi:hypothetical protein